jgi:aspartate racemase
MHIGLIGGIGPAATVAYYQRLVTRVREGGGTLELTIVHADIAALIARGRTNDRDGQARAYATHIDQLRGAGAECAAITSLGGHFCFAETRMIASLPLVSGITPIENHLVAAGMRRVGVLGTEALMRSRLFGQLTQVEAVAPAGDLDALGQMYQEMAVAGACTDAQRATLFEAGRRMVEDQGAEAVVLAGTDLGLAFDGFDPGYRVVDGLDLHVARLADLALGRATLDA